MSETRSICIVVYDRSKRPDSMLRHTAQRLRAMGLHVGGLLQDGKPGDISSCATLVLEDIGTGRRIQVFERRGAEALGCRLDPSGLAEAAGWVREALATSPDVLFINRFGHLEAEGRGILHEIGAAATAGIPMVIAVSQLLLPQWHIFAGHVAFFATTSEQIESWSLAQAAAAS
ncbi:DUF2478 domain-containing protein [Microvirga sp. CF3016]|uniref:DUF2478 domain-containing protein n=1 Tax=Microvirga sp. CF3016 TaxID=3110181 RepID=UPI002E75D7C8|nr:DUF2478 domain-containing protein [Microvirga sp. CF3016]MEE1609882.1 DUF2478 domain-containing protein [Microvirga sp. CF3016]